MNYENMDSKCWKWPVWLIHFLLFVVEEKVLKEKVKPATPTRGLFLFHFVFLYFILCIGFFFELWFLPKMHPLEFIRSCIFVILFKIFFVVSFNVDAVLKEKTKAKTSQKGLDQMYLLSLMHHRKQYSCPPPLIILKKNLSNLRLWRQFSHAWRHKGQLHFQCDVISLKSHACHSSKSRNHCLLVFYSFPLERETKSDLSKKGKTDIFIIGQNHKNPSYRNCNHVHSVLYSEPDVIKDKPKPAHEKTGKYCQLQLLL